LNGKGWRELHFAPVFHLLHHIGMLMPVGERVVNLKEWIMILELHRQGLSVSAIAERTGHDRKTVRKYIREGWQRQSISRVTPDRR
jgi:DNA-binding MarR family transcriptional regulator